MAYSYTPVTNFMDFAVGFKPSGAFPLDVRSMFGSYNAALAAAQTAVEAGSSDSSYYYGQIVSVVENNVVTHYSIQTDKTLKEVGSQPLGDDKTIVVNGNKIGLKSFGTEYYKYIHADNIISGTFTTTDDLPSTDVADGSYAKIGDVWYKYTANAWTAATTEPKTNATYEKVSGWKSGLEPKVASTEGGGYELAWYEPSTTTVEGLNSIVSSLQKNFDVVEKRSAKNTEDITKLNADSTTEGSIDYKIAQMYSKIMENPDEAINSIQELVNLIKDHGEELGLETRLTNLEKLTGKLPEGATSTDIVNYIQEVVKAAAPEDYTNVKAKAESAVQDVKAAATNGQLIVNKGGKEETITAFELKAAKTNELGGVKVDGTSISVAADGTISVEAVDKAKVTGLDDALSTTKSNAVEDAKTYTDQNAVKVSNVVATSADVAASAEAASSEKVLSEKAILSMLEWKTEM